MATDCWLYRLRLPLYRSWPTTLAHLHAHIYPLSQMARCLACHLVVCRAACPWWLHTRAAILVCPACRVSPVHVEAQRGHFHRPRPLGQEPVEHLLGGMHCFW